MIMRGTLLLLLASLLPVSPLRVCLGHICTLISPDASSFTHFTDAAFRECSGQPLPQGLIRWRLFEADSGAELRDLSELPSPPATLLLHPATTLQPDGPTRPSIQSARQVRCGQSELAMLQLLSREGLADGALVQSVGELLAALMCSFDGSHDTANALSYLENHVGGSTPGLHGHVLRAKLKANEGQLDEALEALGLPTEPLPRPTGALAVSAPQPPAAPLTEGIFYQFHHSQLAGMSEAMSQFVRLTQLFPAPPITNMHRYHSRMMASHWRRCWEPPDEQLYGERERLVMTLWGIARVTLTAATRGSPRAPLLCDYGDLLGSCFDLRHGAISAHMHENFTDSMTVNPAAVGIAAGWVDTRIAFGNGWEMLNGKMQLSTASIAARSLLTTTDTATAAAAISLLSAACVGTTALFGETEVAGGRGIYLYPPGVPAHLRCECDWLSTGGFHEWHTNRDHVPGWRMYLTSVDQENASWVGIKDPHTGAVHRMPDRYGAINMFRVGPDPLLWHTIYSNTSRWSFGLVLSDKAAQRVIDAITRK